MSAQALVDQLRSFLPREAVLFEAEDLRPYECDGLSAYRQLPGVVVLPQTEEQIVKILQLCYATRTPLVARGTGTGLSGGALPHAQGVLMSLAKLNRIIAIDRWRAPRGCSPACAIWRSAKRLHRTVCITRPILRRRSPAP